MSDNILSIQGRPIADALVQEQTDGINWDKTLVSNNTLLPYPVVYPLNNYTQASDSTSFVDNTMKAKPMTIEEMFNRMKPEEMRKLLEPVRPPVVDQTELRRIIDKTTQQQTAEAQQALWLLEQGRQVQLEEELEKLSEEADKIKEEEKNKPYVINKTRKLMF